MHHHHHVVRAEFGDGRDGNNGELFQTNANRRHVIVSIMGAFPLASFPLASGADEPSNIQLKSQADEEDPIVLFGKSLMDMSFDSNESIVKDSSSSFDDISLPSSLPEAAEGGDLSQALEQKRLDQKRRIDPRTHG
jgi:hypothetical protein